MRSFPRKISTEKYKKWWVWGLGEKGQLGLGKSITFTVEPKELHLSHRSIKQLTCGANHTLVVSNHEELFSFGIGSNGQLGLGTQKDVFEPTLIHDLKEKKISLIACGGHHSICVTESQSEGIQVFAWGRNVNGQLGIKKEENSTILNPKEIREFKKKKIFTIAAGEDFSVVACDDGIYTFGRGDAGQHISTLSDLDFPQKLPFFQPVKKITCGWGHCLALDLNGKVWSWGSNKHGQCGNGVKSNYLNQIFSLPFNKAVIDIACGAGYSVVITENNEVFLFGSGADGRSKELTDIQHPKKLDIFEGKNASKVSSGSDHIIVKTKDGQLWGFGFGQHGALSSELKNFYPPELIPKTNSILVYSDVFCGMDTTFVSSII